MARPGVTYNLFKSYLRFWHDKIYYKNIYIVGRENVPEDGTPLLIVSDHQNSLNDALGILFSFRDRKAHFITRADVFALSPLANKFLRSIGLLPAFRLRFEGMSALGENQMTFRASEEQLLSGSTVMMFPEAGHQKKHWLGTFSFGYTKLAFEAAEIGNFEKEIFILPACNHYDRYAGIRNSIMVRYGTPVSIKPYYELYKTKPRTAQREVNKLVRAQISSMMLDIRDVDNYTTLDFIRETYGTDRARKQGTNPKCLTEKLEFDKDLIAKLDAAKETDESAVQSLYERYSRFSEDLKKHKIDYRTLTEKRNGFSICMACFLMILLLPVWMFSWWPTVPMYAIPGIFIRRMKDIMFFGTFLYSLNMLFILPFCTITTLLVEGFLFSWIAAIIHVLLFPLLCIFGWNYREWAKRNFRSLRKVFCIRRKDLKNLYQQRDEIWAETDKLINK